MGTWGAAALGRRLPVHPNDIRSGTACWLSSGEKAGVELGLQPSNPAEAWAETLAWLEQLFAGISA